MNSANSNALCLACGMCCNGVIFARGQLQPEDDPARLKLLGLKLLPSRGSEANGKGKFAQPCAAFDGCRCRLYADRPTYCREFDCALLRGVRRREISAKEALRIVRRARRRVETINGLLRELGDSDGSSPLSARFRRVQRRVEASVVDAGTARVFGELTVAMHRLNRLLSERFYPGVTG